MRNSHNSIAPQLPYQIHIKHKVYCHNFWAAAGVETKNQNFIHGMLVCIAVWLVNEMHQRCLFRCS
jgi:hypothetical protein